MNQLKPITLLAAAALLAQPLSAIHWQQVNGTYVAPQSEGARLTQAARDWRHPLVLIDLVRETRSRSRAYQILPRELQDWLIRLGVVTVENDQVTCHRQLSVVAVVHPQSTRPFDASDFLWYRNDVRRGVAALKLFPISPGRIELLEPWDFCPRPDSPRICSLPNGFFRRNFPNPNPEHDDAFRFHVSAANPDEPFAYASLLVDSSGNAQVAIEIIPPMGAEFRTLGNLEELISRFANPDHPVWRQRSSSTYNPQDPNPEQLALRHEHERPNFRSGGEVVQRLRQQFSRTLALCTTPEEAAALQHGDIPSDPEVREVVHTAAIEAAKEAVVALEQAEQQIQALETSAPPTAQEQQQTAALQAQIASLRVHAQFFCRIAQETPLEPTPENPSPAENPAMAEVLDSIQSYSAGLDISLSEVKGFLSNVMENFREMAREAKALKDAVVDFLSAHINEIASALDVIDGIMSIIDASRGFKILATVSARYARWKQNSIQAAQQAGGRRASDSRQFGDFFTIEEYTDFLGNLIGAQTGGIEDDLPEGAAPGAASGGDVGASSAGGSGGSGHGHDHGGADHDHCNGGRHDFGHSREPSREHGRANSAPEHAPEPRAEPAREPSREHDQPARESSHHDPREFHGVREQDVRAGSMGDGVDRMEHEVHEIHATEHGVYHDRVDRFDGFGGHFHVEARVPDRMERLSDAHRESARIAGEARQRESDAGRRNAEAVRDAFQGRDRDHDHGGGHTGGGSSGGGNAGGGGHRDSRSADFNERFHDPDIRAHEGVANHGGGGRDHGGRDSGGGGDRGCNVA